MEKKVLVPHLNTSKKKGILVAWVKEEGQEVKEGDILYEIEVEKVIRQVEAESCGFLTALLVEEGDEVVEGQQVAIIEIEG